MKDKIKLSDSDARKYLRELNLEEKLDQIIDKGIYDKLKKMDYPTKIDFSFSEKTIEKGVRKVIVCVEFAMFIIMAIAVAIIKFL